MLELLFHLLHSTFPADFTLGLLSDNKHGADMFLGFIFPFICFLFTLGIDSVKFFCIPVREAIFGEGLF
jgi:hypothetical protein